MVSVPVLVVFAVAAVVGFAGSKLVGCIFDMGNPGISAGTAGIAHSDIGLGTPGTAHSDIGPGTAGTVRFGIGPDTSGIVRFRTDPGIYSDIDLGRCWVVHTAQDRSIVVVDMMAGSGIAQAEGNFAAYTLPAEASIGPILVGQVGRPSPSPMEYKLEAAPVRPPPVLGSFLSFWNRHPLLR